MNYIFRSRLILLAFVALSIPARALADDFSDAHGDFFHLLFSQREEIKGQYVFEKGHEEEGGPGKFDLNHFSLDAEVPLSLSKQNYFRLGAGYAARLYDFENVSGARTREGDETLHRAEIVGGFGRFITADTLITAAARLGAFSDFDNGLDGDDFQVNGEGLALFRLNPGAMLLFGVRVSEDFDDIPVLPLIGFRMLSDDGKIHVSLTAPVELKVAYNLDPEVQLYLRGSIIGEEYRVDAGEVEDRFRLHLQDRRLGVGTDIWLTEHFKLGAEAGMSIGSELEFKTEAAGQFSKDLDLAGYFLANIGVAL